MLENLIWAENEQVILHHHPTCNLVYTALHKTDKETVSEHERVHAEANYDVS